jgi:hypothetical protein
MAELTPVSPRFQDCSKKLNRTHDTSSGSVVAPYSSSFSSTGTTRKQNNLLLLQRHSIISSSQSLTSISRQMNE